MVNLRYFVGFYTPFFSGIKARKYIFVPLKLATFKNDVQIKCFLFSIHKTWKLQTFSFEVLNRHSKRQIEEYFQNASKTYHFNTIKNGIFYSNEYLFSQSNIFISINLRPFKIYLLRDILSSFLLISSTTMCRMGDKPKRITMYFKSSNFVAQATEIVNIRLKEYIFRAPEK